MNNYFCVLPFYGVEIGHNISKNIHCCELPAGTDIKKVQESIVAQQRSPSCYRCWQLEDQGLTSSRKLHNQSFDFYLNLDLEKIEQDAVNHLNQPQIIKIHTSNLCNGTCVTCNSICSSAWASLENKQINYNKISIKLIENINWADVKQLTFVGGEPLLEKLNFEILNLLLDSGNTSCFISIVTNGSCALTPGQFETLSQFENLNICLSIDGVGPRFEYIRYPLSWDLLCENLEKFRKITSNISVNATISNLNIFYYSELIDFFNAHQLNYMCRHVEFPLYFSPGNLPDAFKQQVLENNPQYHDQVKSFLGTGHYSASLFAKFCQEIQRQDSLKKISISDYLPLDFYQNLA